MILGFYFRLPSSILHFLLLLSALRKQIGAAVRLTTRSPHIAPPESGSPHSAPTISPVTSASPPAPVAPSPSDLEEGKSPASSPAPSPDASDINHSNINADGSEEYVGGGGGMSGGKKAGIVVAVLVVVCLVGLGGLVYKKRQDNIRRTQYGYAARREIM
ncbi:hypothetical protein CCACVL1_18081 [Corchorus capsularis]|uniref:Uncharacterized protein n=1 Tax=Corchorus capsularis TaxID=210143 RepID=A0A1R3HN85_COCAP|nr:hypothetical protein CCACVL1_18081 [Corchorus capsularis]